MVHGILLTPPTSLRLYLLPTSTMESPVLEQYAHWFSNGSALTVAAKRDMLLASTQLTLQEKLELLEEIVEESRKDYQRFATAVVKEGPAYLPDRNQTYAYWRKYAAMLNDLLKQRSPQEQSSGTAED